MDLAVSFDDTNHRAQRLREIFGVDDDALEERVTALASAALEEYELALSGERPATGIRDLRELRLNLLYKHLPDGEPTDDQIAELFLLTRAQVATLVAGTRARFGPAITGRLRGQAKAALVNATNVDDDTVRVVMPDSLGRYMKDLVAQTEAQPLEKRRDASRTYDIGRDTLSALAAKLGFDASEVTAIDWPD
jgi:hypothetical protein